MYICLVANPCFANLKNMYNRIAKFFIITLPNNCFLLTADEFTDSHPFGDSTDVCIVILDTYEITWLTEMLKML